jgi:NhaP-type Na+/H+ or K+/H+ antiporter
MSTMSTELFVVTLALVGVVIVIAALLSGLVERSGLPQVVVFLALGVVVGPAGFGLLDVTLTSPVLRVVATLSLVLVLFTDAIAIDVGEVRRRGPLALVVLGPGTLVPAVVVALAGWWLLGLAPPAAAILGAALASTDPVLLRGLLRRRDVPGDARYALQLESGLNDAVLLPVVLVAMAFASHNPPGDPAGWARLAVDLFILGPGAGVLVGLVAIAALDLVRRTIGIARDYESLYALGIPLTAAAAAEAVHGSGFLAAFAAGLTIAAFDVDLCECFHEYGQATAEMALLLTFVLFGGSLIWSGLTVLDGATAIFAALALAARPGVMLPSLRAVGLDHRSRALITWFGPRGLSSLLLVLLPVFAGLPGAERLFAACSLVVILSIALHGGTLALVPGDRRGPQRRPAAAPAADPAAPAAPAGSPPGPAAEPPVAPVTPSVSAPGAGSASDPRRAAEWPAAPVTPSASARGAAPSPTPAAEVRAAEAAEATHTPVAAPFDGREPRSAAGRTSGATTAAGESPGAGDGDDGERLSVDDLRRLWQRGEPVVVLDARTDSTYGRSDSQGRGALRLPAARAAREAAAHGLPYDAWLVVYCA